MGLLRSSNHSSLHRSDLATPSRWFLGLDSSPRRRSTRARRRHPHPLSAGFLHCVSALPDPLDVDPPIEFEEQPPEASEQQQGINFEEGKYNINNT
ncbi:hypothetical protein U9M48_028437 [Paspalum notatum var. saurae]|uniref:Uncharacterized protein n=1 Tax=Paspalum notatum var. saurae TaxID=547442 RepID=A0AAQ3X1J5_PASNO